MSEKIIKRTKKSISIDDKKETKQKLGQFFTTNYEYILQDFKIQNMPLGLKKLICSKDYKFIKDFVGIEVETY